MSFNNIIAIIGDKFDAINLISSKLVLLRDLDKVVDTNLENATTFLNQTMPNVIIVHSTQLQFMLVYGFLVFMLSLEYHIEETSLCPGDKITSNPSSL